MQDRDSNGWSRTVSELYSPPEDSLDASRKNEQKMNWFLGKDVFGNKVDDVGRPIYGTAPYYDNVSSHSSSGTPSWLGSLVLRDFGTLFHFLIALVVAALLVNPAWFPAYLTPVLTRENVLSPGLIDMTAKIIGSAEGIEQPSVVLPLSVLSVWFSLIFARLIRTRIREKSMGLISLLPMALVLGLMAGGGYLSFKTLNDNRQDPTEAGALMMGAEFRNAHALTSEIPLVQTFKSEGTALPPDAFLVIESATGVVRYTARLPSKTKVDFPLKALLSFEGCGRVAVRTTPAFGAPICRNGNSYIPIVTYGPQISRGSGTQTPRIGESLPRAIDMPIDLLLTAATSLGSVVSQRQPRIEQWAQAKAASRLPAEVKLLPMSALPMP